MNWCNKTDKRYASILKAIKKYDTIIILRHEMPDFDASGSQFGLKSWILHHFPTKKVYALGENHKYFSEDHSLYPKTDILLERPKDYLVFILDVANFDRIDGKEIIQNASYTIKIDHHIFVESFGDIEIVKTDYSAACELIAEMLLSFKKYKMNQEAAYYLYSGLVGDNGRFQYSSTSQRSFEIAAQLIHTGIDFTDIYEKMYTKNLEDIKILKYLYNHYQISKHGVIYTHTDRKALEELGIEREKMKAYVNLFSGYKESRIWVSFTEDAEKNIWMVSIRSRKIPINMVAERHHGGGHANASGARVETYEETMQIIQELDDLLK